MADKFCYQPAKKLFCLSWLFPFSQSYPCIRMFVVSLLYAVVATVEAHQYSAFFWEERSAEGEQKYLFRSCCLLSTLQKCCLILGFILC